MPLQFITGIPDEPPIGFIPQPSVASSFSIANACGNIIHLPTIHTSLDQFRRYITLSSHAMFYTPLTHAKIKQYCIMLQSVMLQMLSILQVTTNDR